MAKNKHKIPLILTFVIILIFQIGNIKGEIPNTDKTKWEPDNHFSWPPPEDIPRLSKEIRSDFYKFLFEKAEITWLSTYLNLVNDIETAGQKNIAEIFSALNSQPGLREKFHKNLKEFVKVDTGVLNDLFALAPVEEIKSFAYYLDKDSLLTLWKGKTLSRETKTKILLGIELEKDSGKKSEKFLGLWNGVDDDQKKQLEVLFNIPESLQKDEFKEMRNSFISSLLTDEKIKKYHDKNSKIDIDTGSETLELVKDKENYFFKIKDGPELRSNRWLSNIKVNPDGKTEFKYFPYGKDKTEKKVIISKGCKGYIDEYGYYKEAGKTFGNHMFGEKTVSIGKDGKNTVIEADNQEIVDVSNQKNPKAWVLVDNALYTVPDKEKKFTLEFDETGKLVSKSGISIGTAPKEYSEKFQSYINEYDKYLDNLGQDRSKVGEQLKQYEDFFRKFEVDKSWRAFFEISNQDGKCELFIDKNVPSDYLDGSKIKSGKPSFFQLDSNNNLIVNKLNNILGMDTDNINSVKAYDSKNLLLAKTKESIEIQIDGEKIKIPNKISGNSFSSDDKNKIIRFEGNNGLLINPSQEKVKSGSQIEKILKLVDKNSAVDRERQRQEEERKRQQEIQAQENNAIIQRQQQEIARKNQIMNSDLGKLIQRNAIPRLDYNKKYTVVIFGEFCGYCTGLQASLDSLVKNELASRGLTNYVDIQLTRTKNFVYGNYPIITNAIPNLMSRSSGYMAGPKDMHQLVFEDGNLIYYNRGYGAQKEWYGRGSLPQIQENKAGMIVDAIQGRIR